MQFKLIKFLSWCVPSDRGSRFVNDTLFLILMVVECTNRVVIAPGLVTLNSLVFVRVIEPLYRRVALLAHYAVLALVPTNS